VTLKKNRRALAVALTVDTVAPMDVLRSGLGGKAAKEIRKAFDAADVFVLSLGAKPTYRHVVDQSLA
jgi:hypothetical protein